VLCTAPRNLPTFALTIVNLQAEIKPTFKVDFALVLDYATMTAYDFVL